MQLQVIVLVCLIGVALAGFKKSTFKADLVREHNAKRQGEPAKSMPNLKWSNKLAKYGQAWADNCKFAHGQPPAAKGQTIGQNLYASWGRSTTHIGKTAVDAWFGEKNDYTFSSGACTRGKMCGHYTQVVWAKSTQVGCGYKHCAGGMDLIVCNYLKAGNYIGQKPYERS